MKEEIKDYDVLKQKFLTIIKMNKTLLEILTVLDELNIEDCFVTAGAINQTIFNYLHGYEITKNIEDYDIVYFDNDISYEKEDFIIKKITKALKHLNVKLDIKNEARVHLWYEKKFNRKLKPYNSIYDAISRWGTTVTCIGIKKQDDKFIVYAPFGFDDLFNMIIRPNKQNMQKEIYEEKIKKWKSKWPNLKIIPWDE